MDTGIKIKSWSLPELILHAVFNGLDVSDGRDIVLFRITSW
jgi:hypothetical protein